MSDLRYYGLYPAIVTNLVDPDQIGRVQVQLPWLGNGNDVRVWATLLTPYADDDQGLQILPEVDTQVVVGFEAGDPHRAYIVGSCWNGKEMMPVSATRPNNKRVWRTRAKSSLEFDDTEGAAKVTLQMQSGHKIVLDDSADQVEVTHSNGSTIKINAAGQISVTANATVEVTASAVNVHAATAAFDGIVSCTTLIASSGVVSPSYTPGAGNIW